MNAKNKILPVVLVTLFSGHIAHAQGTKNKMECDDINQTVFSCLTPSKNKILVCADNGAYQYHYIRRGKNNTEIFSSDNSIAKHNWNGNTEAISFFKKNKEYKVYANYSKKYDPKNIFDDNISGGVTVYKNGKKVSFAKCGATPDSVNFINIFEPTI